MALDKTLAGIDAAMAAGFSRIKLNTVVLKHRNHDEVGDLVAFAVARGLDISFIEEMPLGLIGDHDRAEAFYPSEAIRADLAGRFELIPTTQQWRYRPHRQGQHAGGLGAALNKPIGGFGELFRQLSYDDIGASTIQARPLPGWPTAP